MRRIGEIQVLRAIAACLVVADHSILLVLPANPRMEYLAWTLGDIGVGIFFVVSGFIMVASSYRGEVGIKPIEFVKRRVLRVVPLYWIFTLVLAASLIWHQFKGEDHLVPSIQAQLAKSLFFIPYLDPYGMIRPILGVGWTLNLEMMFYAIFALALLFPRRSGIALTTLVLVGLSTAGRVIAGPDWGSEYHTALEFVTFPIILLFGAGMLIALFPFGWLRERVGAIPHSATILAVIPAAMALVFVAGDFAYPVTVGWRAAVWAACALYVFLTIALDRETLGSRYTAVLNRLGDASYSIYISQTLVFGYLKHHDMLGLSHAALGLQFGTAFLLPIGFGLLVNLALEKPLLKLAHLHLARSKTPPGNTPIADAVAR